MYATATVSGAVSKKSALGESFVLNRWLFVTVLVCGATAWGAAAYFGLEERIAFRGYLWPMLLFYSLSIVLFLLGYVFYVMIRVRPRALARYLLETFRDRIFTPTRLVAGVQVLILVPIFTSIFTSMKILIPKIHPFAWDETFIRWDQWLHGGYHPWEILQPVLGYPLISSAINVFYNIWFILLYVSFFFFAFKTNSPRLRMQFLLSMMLSWALIGNLTATLLSSVGPCFYFLYTGAEDPFADLLAYLRAANEEYKIWALDIQNILWRSYIEADQMFGRGISAMPSMHVASSFVFFLAWRRVHRYLGWALAAFVVIIQIGSVHLAYHYAIDGYVAIAMAGAIWWLVGKALTRDVSLDATRPAPTVAR